MIALSLPLAAWFSASPERATPGRLPLNWRRVTAYSGTLSLHLVLALALLIPPAAMEIQRLVDTQKVFPVTPILVQPEEKPQPRMPVPPTQQKKVTPSPPTPQITMSMPVPLPTPVAPPVAPFAPANASSGVSSGVGDGKEAADAKPSPLAYLNRTAIPYPSESLRHREQGTVVLRVLVGADGNPQEVEIDKSSGSHTLDNAARSAVKHWSFSPGLRGGKAYATWALVPVSFNLPM